MKKSIVCLSGTGRPGNFTSRALGVVEKHLSENGYEVTTFDGRNIKLNFPGEETSPDAERMTKAVHEATAVVIATPEYHGTFSAMTKLMLENLGFPSELAKKPVALLGVAAGRIGAIKSLEHLRGTCSHMGALVIPGAVSIAGVQHSFDDEGRCTDENTEKALHSLALSLEAFVKDYVCPKLFLEESVRVDGSSWTTHL